jgi:NAD(P)-dependent dehydrogenase (short-subunit alcohol dehydrogenase family)
LTDTDRKNANEKLTQKIPLNRLGEPDEVADAALLLASSASSRRPSCCAASSTSVARQTADFQESLVDRPQRPKCQHWR